MQKVEALLVDVFGTVVDWRSTVTRELKQMGEKHGAGPADWAKFAQEWRMGYIQHTRRIAAGGSGSLNVDAMHREILDNMLKSSEWSHLGPIWKDEERSKLNQSWHDLDGWQDASPGMYAMKKHYILAALSNGDVRLLVDMAKHADLPWDAVFSAELFQAYKPNPKVYLSAAHHLSVPPERCAMVAAHIYDLRAAANLGMQTIYIPREGEDIGENLEVKPKSEGGEVDWVVKDFNELAARLNQQKDQIP